MSSRRNREPPLCPAEGSPCRFSEELEELRQTVSVLSDLVITDELTGLHNYRHFVSALDVEIERSRRTGNPVALMILDIDNFKNANDHHGHEFGNCVLAQLADLLRESLRKPDIPCRYGGEEFAVILPDTPLPQALQLAERLRSNIADMRVPWKRMKMAITVSIGVDAVVATESTDPGDLIEQADNCLRAAKREGKNRIDYPADKMKGGLTAEERDALLDDT